MPANSPQEICRLLQQYMREGDLESVLSLYDREVVFLNEAVEESRGLTELREEPDIPCHVSVGKRTAPRWGADKGDRTFYKH